MNPVLRRGVAVSGACHLVVLFLILAVLPAEFGIDPTGAGKALGLTRLADPAMTPELARGAKRSGVPAGTVTASGASGRGSIASGWAGARSHTPGTPTRDRARAGGGAAASRPAAARSAAGGPGPLVPIEGKNHFDIMEALRAPDGELLAAARRLLAA